jgi:hypothetical protein
MTDADKYRWAPPSHPDPPDDQPLGVDADPNAAATPDLPPVWVTVDFTRTGPQRLPGFVERASPELACVQFVHMGHPHRCWLPRDRITHRTLRARGRS